MAVGQYDGQINVADPQEIIDEWIGWIMVNVCVIRGFGWLSHEDCNDHENGITVEAILAATAAAHEHAHETDKNGHECNTHK